MKKELIFKPRRDFEQHAYEQDVVALGYTPWQSFAEVIGRAKTVCAIAGQAVEDHFGDAGKVVDFGSGASSRNEFAPQATAR